MDNAKPERKVVGAAVAVIVIAILGRIWPDFDVPLGLEGAVTVIVAYLLPNPE